MALPKVTDNLEKSNKNKATEYNKPVYAETTDDQGNKTIFWNDDSNAQEIFENYKNTDISQRGNYSVETNIDNGKVSIFEDYVSVSLDKDTGDIKVKAPQYVLDRDVYQESYKPYLEGLSAKYKSDPEYKVASANDDSKEYSIEEAVNEINGELSKKDFINSAKSIDGIKRGLISNGWKDVTDEDAQIIASGNYQALSSDANDYTTVNVSDFASTNFFKNLESYDATTKTVTLGDLKKALSRENVSDEDYLDFYRKLSTVTSDVTYDENGNATVKKGTNPTVGSVKDYAARVALRNYMENKSPEVGVLRGISDQLSNFWVGMADSIVGTAADIIDFITPGEWDVNKNYKKGMALHDERTKLLNSNALVFKTIGEFGGIALDLAVGTKVTGALKAAAISGKLSKAINLERVATNLSKTSKALEAAKTPEEFVNAAKAFNSAGKALRANTVVDGVSTVLRYNSAEDAAKLVSTALKASVAATKISESAVASAKAINAFASIAQFVTDSIVGTVIIEPDLLVKISNGDPDGYTTQELIENLAIDSAVFGSLKGAGLAAKKIGDTAIGAAISGNASRTMAKLEVKLTDAKNKVKAAVFDATPEETAMANLKAESNVSKAKGVAQASNIAITEAKRELANTKKIKWFGKNLEEVRKLTEPVTKAKIGVMAANNAVDQIQRGIKGMVNESIVDNKEIYDSLIGSMKKLTNAEKAAGRINKRARGLQDEGLRLLSQDTANYITASNRVAYWMRKGVSDADKESYKDALDQIAKFEASATPEIKELANNVRIDLEAAYKQFTDYYIEKGALSRDEIEELRKSSLWGSEGQKYMRSQRIKKNKGHFVSNEKDLTATTQKMASGTGDFADPMLVFADWMARLADKTNRNNAARLLFISNGSSKLASNTLTQSLRNASHAAQTRFNKSISNDIDGVLEDLQSSDIFGDIYNAQEGKKEILVQKNKTDKAYKNILKARDKEYMSSQAARTIYISELPDERLDKLSEMLVGYKTPTEYIDNMVAQGYTEKEAFDYWLTTIPNNTKKYVERYITESLEVQGYTIPKGYDVLTVDNFNSLSGKRASTVSTAIDDNNKIQGSSYTVNEAKDMAKKHIESLLLENNLDDVTVKGIELNGSRLRGDAKETSDLDVVIEYDGDIREDDLFGVLNDEDNKLYLDDIAVDINPIKADKSGTLEEYMKRSKEYDDGIKKTTSLNATKVYKDIVNTDELFERNIMSNLLSSNKEYRDSELVSEAISSEVRNYEMLQKSTLYQKELKQLNELQKRFNLTGEEGWGEGKLFDLARRKVSDSIDNVIENAINHNNGKTIQSVINVAKVDDPGTKTYLALLSFKKGSKNRTKLLNSIDEIARNEFRSYANASGLSKKINAQTFQKSESEFVSTIRELTKGEIDDRINNLYQVLSESKNPVADYEYAFQEVDRIRKELTKEADDPSVIALGVRDGEVEYFRTSPVVASLVRSNIGYTQATGSYFQNIGYFWSKIFRLGTTGLRMKSWLMQMSRDSIALYSGIGAFSTLTKATNTLQTEFGPELIENMRRFNTELYDRTLKELKKEGLTGEELNAAMAKTAAEREMNAGFGRATTASETAAYTFRKNNYGALSGDKEPVETSAAIGKFSTALDDVMSKETIGATKIPNPLNLNSRREDYMRKLAFSNSYAKGMKKGYGAENSKIYAEFIMNNATTNFSRTTVHLSNLQKSVPYLGAAINGTKSFYRLLQMDPVGVMGRLIGGVIIPATAITALSLSEEENRKVYNNIPEYEKADNICIVWDGKLIKVPIPQEMKSIFGVPRMFVEKTFDVGYNSFWELAANNAIGISPIDLSGFLNLDNKNLFENNPDIWNNLTTGFVKMSAQLMNPAMKTGVMITTGIDPYTGKRINTAYKAFDEDTGETNVIDYYSGEFAKTLGQMFGFETNAYMAQVIIDNLIGNVGDNLLNSLTTMSKRVSSGDDFWNAFGDAAVGGTGAKEAMGAYTGEVYDRAQSAWAYTMRELQNQKEQIVNSKEYQSVKNSITFATSDEAREKARGKLNDMLQPLYQNTLNAVNNLNSKYSAQFTRSKFASIISLFNTAESTPLANISNYSTEASQDAYYAGRNMAIETMYNMGFTSPNDKSLFGYVKKSGDGYEFVYQDPISILMFEQLGYAQNDIHKSNISAIFDKAEIKSISSLYYNDPNYAAAKKAGSKAFKQYKANHNAEVVKALSEYVNKYGVESVMSSNVVDYLDEYIFVNNPYKAKEYIKSIFEETK